MNTIQQAHILLVDDNTDLLRLLEEQLRGAGYQNIRTVQNCAAAQTAFAAEMPELMILDINLPDGDGFSLFRTRRAKADVPTLFLSARDADADRLFGLGLGADDYLTKPFGTVELRARIRTALRHTRTDGTSDGLAMTGEYRVGDLCIDYNKHRVFLAGEDTHLTPNEYKIVALLGKYAGKVLTYDYLIQQIWGPKAKADNQILRVNMANIRRKIEKNPASPEYIFTEIGVGYRMLENDA